MKNRQGQITVYIILGLVIIAAVSFILLIRETMREEAEEAPLSDVPLEARPIKIFVENCLEELSSSGIYFLGIQGGYIHPPLEKCFLTDSSTIAYYYYEGEDVSLSKETIERELARYLEAVLPGCINNFKDFDDKAIEAGKFKVAAKINQDSVKIRLDYPVSIIQDGRNIEIGEFAVSIPIRLGYILDISKKIVQKEIESQDDLNIHFLDSFDFEVSVLPYDRENIIYSIVDRKFTVEDEPFVFLFANKMATELPLEIEFIPDFIVKKGSYFEYQIKLTSPGEGELKFSIISDSIRIKPDTGLMWLVAAEEGGYKATACVEDAHEKKDCQDFTVRVENAR